ncbi:MAG: PilZ domain-containing protein [Oscillospiraceae bacterium]|nr:PilZ domain-containing protein [Oscillospiraceae bacterium]
MPNPKRIKSIQIFEGNQMLLEFKKNYSFGKNNTDALSIRGKKLPRFEVGHQFGVVFNNKSGERIRHITHVEFSSDRTLDLRVNYNEEVRLEDKRRFYKIKTEINCRILSATRGEEVVTFKTSNLYGRIQDINIGGVFIAIDDNLCFEKEDLLTFSTVLGEHKLRTTARILRVQRDNAGEITGYGCAFIDIKPYQEEMISSYVTRIQIEERQLEREKELLEKELFLR